jgi:hypothetical protein
MSAKMLLAAASLAATSLAAAAQAAEPAAKTPRSCFFTSQISSFNPVDDRTINIRVGVRDVYQLALIAPCPDVKWHESLAIQSRGSSSICSGLDAEVITRSPIGPQRCPVQTVRKLSPEEVAALPRRQKP